jgi:hypothetical protein
MVHTFAVDGGRVCVLARSLEAGRGPGLAVGRSLVTRYLTNSRSAGLGCASWWEEEDGRYSQARTG